MPKKPIKIIGINPGTRYLGLAFFQGAELRDWRVRVVNGVWSKKKQEKTLKVISDFIDQYEPDVMAIKTLHPSRSSKNLKQLVSHIKILSEEKSLRAYEYSVQELEEFFIDQGKTNKKKMASILAGKYLDLSNELEKERSNRNPYHIRMFEAVALGSVCFEKLENN